MPVNHKRRQRRKRGLVSGRKKQTGPHNKTKSKAVAATGRTSGRYSVLKFLLIFGVLLAAFYVFTEFSPFYNKRFVPSHHHLIAKVSGALLAVLGQDITVTGKSIHSPRFSVRIIRGCDAVEAIALYVCAVLAFPLPFLKKLSGIIAGTLLLLILNLIRIVSLFLIGVYSRRIFDLMHIDVWQAIFIFFAVLLWILWLLWATRSQVVTRPASS
ncbi:MAG: exosortase H [Planctomycetes bacterium]|nr:exosortase H [Planctomycetota bacterium]